MRFPSHAKGERCPVVDLLVGEFGEDFGGYLLYEFTCFPMSDEHAWRQAHALVGANRLGILNAYLAAERAKQEEWMSEVAA